MWIAAAEFFVWALLGLAAGFIGHWWKANANQYPDILDKDRPLLAAERANRFAARADLIRALKLRSTSRRQTKPQAIHIEDI
jgi:hypothetical protein